MVPDWLGDFSQSRAKKQQRRSGSKREERVRESQSCHPRCIGGSRGTCTFGRACACLIFFPFCVIWCCLASRDLGAKSFSGSFCVVVFVPSRTQSGVADTARRWRRGRAQPQIEIKLEFRMVFCRSCSFAAKLTRLNMNSIKINEGRKKHCSWC